MDKSVAHILQSQVSAIVSLPLSKQLVGISIIAMRKDVPVSV